jgi:hypothetical protein
VKEETLKKIFDFLEKEENRKKPFAYKLTFNEPLTEKDLNIEGDLNLPNLKITSLPKVLKVGGRLDLTNSDIETLPEGLEVGHSLWLAGCWGLTSLPKDLKVGGNLYIYRTKFTEISDNELVNMIRPNGYIKGEILGNI